MTVNPTLDQIFVTPTRSRADQLADTLVRHITRSGLGPGDRLGTLDEIRAEVGFARTTVSEAVRLLRERGMLEIRPGRGGGLFIADETPIVRMRHTLLRVQGTGLAVAEAVELREALEEPIALSAAASCTPTDGERLRAAAAAMAGCGHDFDEFIRLNWGLHGAIAELCPNSMMSAIYRSCLGYLTRSGGSYDESGAVADYIETRAAVHTELVEAILSAEPARIRAAVDAHNHGTGTEATR